MSKPSSTRNLVFRGVGSNPTLVKCFVSCLLRKVSVPFQDGIMPLALPPASPRLLIIVLLGNLVADIQTANASFEGLNELWQLASTPGSGALLPRIKKLMRITVISHKYQIIGTRTWAVNGVSDLYEKYELEKSDAGLPSIFVLEPTNDLLERFTIAAEISQKKDLFEKAQQVWISEIEYSFLAPSICTPSTMHRYDLYSCVDNLHAAKDDTRGDIAGSQFTWYWTLHTLDTTHSYIFAADPLRVISHLSPSGLSRPSFVHDDTQDSPIFRTKLAAVDVIKTVNEDGSRAIAQVLDDDASSFRAFPNKFWEFVNYPLTDAVMLWVKKLSTVSLLYEKSWEAKKNLDAHFSCVFEPNNDLLKYFTIATEFSQNEVMFGKAKQTWVKRIESGRDTPYQALVVARDKGWRHFEGRVYLAILRALTKSNPLNASSPHAPPTFGLSRTEPPVPFLNAWKNAIKKGTLPLGPNTPLTRSLTTDQIARLSNGHLVLTQLQREFVGVNGWHLSLTSFNQFAHRFEASFWEDFRKACVRHATGQQETRAIHDDVFALMKHIQEFMEEIVNGKATLEGFNGVFSKVLVSHPTSELQQPYSTA
ncbi:hypothetical protein NP233_g5831 [Leucocoprinus birnbaumii]|uniref:Uncharacterized protein n=1 Tax=Leucocoprinus birnbaumii TaxID=56174 RepID=A0AAD5VS35_9AGAR|nr:hypothetical protein NP233_g5831 [Leucocoprinus birnbaumii]